MRTAKQKIILFVCGIHALIFCVALFHSHFSPKPKKKPLVVHTIQAQPKVIAVAAPPPPKPTAKPASAPAPKPISTQKKEPAIADKKITTKKTPPKQEVKVEPRAKISDALKRELEESLSKLEASPVRKQTKTASVPSQTLQIDSVNLSHSYSELLIATLHQALKLPEIGEVKIQLTLRQDGTVAKLVVLKSESQKNKSYLEAQLPYIRCPRLDGEPSRNSEHTFTLTFCNEL